MLNTDEDIKFIWDLIINQKLPISHNFYLKYFSLMQENELNKYDFILLDEAQDTNEVMLNVFLNNNCSKILVGDTFQNIYGFNKTINALEILDTNYECNLSTSFRSRQNILNYANYFLKKYSNKNILDMKSSITFKDDLILENKAYISRTNAEIIKFISELMKSKQDLNNYCLLKNPKDIFSLLFDIISCLAGNYDFISKQNSFLKKFNSLLEIKKYAENILDNELKNALNLLNKNYDFKAIYKVATKLYYNKNAKNFIINAHLSKGLEWDCVVLLNDFIDLSEKYHSIKKEKNMIKKENLKKYLEQELNLFYVAITRAKFKITDMSKNAPEC
ncbi:UvrD-helicase domain-containing protein [Campylobacter coli]|nr:UvrD-helicase domain-containing protein [Campylobacter coli]EGI9537068.1 UvrD-helicase domain-containing protein [Campylobacter coli]